MLGIMNPIDHVGSPFLHTQAEHCIERERLKLPNSCMVIGSASQLPKVELWVVLSVQY